MNHEGWSELHSTLDEKVMKCAHARRLREFKGAKRNNALPPSQQITNIVSANEWGAEYRAERIGFCAEKYSDNGARRKMSPSS